ncbi:hypothetical protein SDC9_190151 [bioreactor metagenome]|uniref:Uncharacterized protein n=1 Tax=bioreactor metagenome TaxID=1076179 RepID=A0A645I298_9ZZZZ
MTGHYRVFGQWGSIVRMVLFNMYAYTASFDLDDNVVITANRLRDIAYRTIARLFIIESLHLPFTSQ